MIGKTERLDKLIMFSVQELQKVQREIESRVSEGSLLSARHRAAQQRLEGLEIEVHRQSGSVTTLRLQKQDL